MAEYDSPQKTKQQYLPRAGEMAVAWGVAEVTSSLTTADHINYFTLPDGAEVLGGWLRGQSLDTGALLTVNVGYDADHGKYFQSYTGVQSNYYDHLQGDLDDPTIGGVLAALSEDKLVRMYVTVDAGGLSGTPVSALVIEYTRSIT